MSSSILFLNLLAAAGSATLLPNVEVTAVDGELRLGQVVDLHGFDSAAHKRLDDTVIADFARTIEPKEISGRSIRRWTVAAVPKLRFQHDTERKIMVRFASGRAPNDASALLIKNCFSTSSEIFEDEIVTRKNVSAAACQKNHGKAVVYFDAGDRVVRASQTLSAGTYLGRLRVPATPAADRGSPMAFVTNEGPVRVIRNVRALQPAISGKSVFVVANDGTVFATKYRAAEDRTEGAVQ